MSFVATAIAGSAALAAGSQIAAGRSARKAAKKASKKQEKQDALANLINTMLGKGATSREIAPVPNTTASDIMGGMANIGMAYAQGQQMSELNKLRQAQTTATTQGGAADILRAQAALVAAQQAGKAAVGDSAFDVYVPQKTF